MGNNSFYLEILGINDRGNTKIPIESYGFPQNTKEFSVGRVEDEFSRYFLRYRAADKVINKIILNKETRIYGGPALEFVNSVVKTIWTCKIITIYSLNPMGPQEAIIFGFNHLS